MTEPTDDRIELPPSVVRDHLKCGGCLAILLAGTPACPSCGSSRLLTYIDRRPLLLSPRLVRQLETMLDAAGDRLAAGCGLEEVYYLAGDWIPFLVALLIDSSEAERRLRSGGGVRQCILDDDEALACIRNHIVPIGR